MSLYLVQHAKALSKDQDPERGLSDEGIAEASRIAKVAAGYDVAVARVLHSGKKRARQTAEIFAEALKPAKGMEATDGLAPLDDVAVFASRIAGDDDIMLVGHMPFMSRLASHLVTGNQKAPVFLFQNGGIVCLRKLPKGEVWAIQWALMPNVS